MNDGGGKLDATGALEGFTVDVVVIVEIVGHDHCVHDLDSDDDDAVVRANVADFYIKLVNTTAADDRHGFIELMKSLDVRAYREFRGYKNLEAYEMDSCPLDFFGRICGIGAIDCVTALLEGESGLVLDLKLDPELGRCPLHVAANKMSYNVIDLLLRYGARTDLKSKETGTGKGGLLPLSVALEKLSYHESLYDWSPKDSAVKLITKLCLPNMMTEQEAVRGITVLLEENGFILKSEDICARYSGSEKPKLEARLSDKRTAFGYPFSGSWHTTSSHNPNTNEMYEAKVALSPLRFFRPGLSPFLKSYRSWFDDPFEKRKTTAQKSLQDLLSAKTYGRFGLLLKRGIRSI
ncbi:hypothetical protein Vadar_024117 [Vaccinium darrowii]|uniref:Uncharacterized protein n=1 Tax=Vaccinium darrowii TaxID=229202 RepID=A0ACB7Y184_9ERIC|nr:hypothetical protein Vadar_024117 [Vaccinium darrowii]